MFDYMEILCRKTRSHLELKCPTCLHLGTLHMDKIFLYSFLKRRYLIMSRVSIVLNMLRKHQFHYRTS